MKRRLAARDDRQHKFASPQKLVLYHYSRQNYCDKGQVLVSSSNPGIVNFLTNYWIRDPSLSCRSIPFLENIPEFAIEYWVFHDLWSYTMKGRSRLLQLRFTMGFGLHFIEQIIRGFAYSAAASPTVMSKMPSKTTIWVNVIELWRWDKSIFGIDTNIMNQHMDKFIVLNKIRYYSSTLLD